MPDMMFCSMSVISVGGTRPVRVFFSSSFFAASFFSSSAICCLNWSLMLMPAPEASSSDFCESSSILAPYSSALFTASRYFCIAGSKP